MRTQVNPDCRPASDEAGWPDTPGAEILSEGGAILLYLSGEWSLRTLETARKKLHPLMPRVTSLRGVNIDRVTRLDTAGAMLVNTLRLTPGQTRPLPLFSKNEKFLRLADFCPVCPNPPPDVKPSPLLCGLNRIGKTVTEEFIFLGQFVGFLGYFLIVFSKVLVKPWKLPWTSLVYHMNHVGVKAIPIVALLSFLTGLVIAYMAAAQLALFGAQIFVVPLLEITTNREMGPLLTAILVAGRSGSSFTAQIGTMIANEEVDAMRSMGLDPMILLVLPRVLALILTLPVMVLVADLMSLFGGMMAIWFSMDITPAAFIPTLQKHMGLKHFLLGMVKTPFFAATIGCIGCFLGLKVTGSAESVGKLTTKSVVEGIFLIIVLNAVFALLYSAMRI